MTEKILRFMLYSLICALQFYWGYLDGKKKASENPKKKCCRDCRYCFPIPEESRSFFLAHERHCVNGRGHDILFDSANMGGTVSTVSIDGCCNEFSPKDAQEVSIHE